MRTLEQIEPRTPIITAPFTITAPGSYYLAANVHLTTTATAITIASDNVTLDLGGFTISSDASTSGTGIQVQGTRQNVTIRNGVILGTTTVTITGTHPNRTWSRVQGGFQRGILASNANSRGLWIENVKVSGCRTDGFVVHARGAVIVDCVAAANGGFGIAAGFGMKVERCLAQDNFEDGIHGFGIQVIESGAIRNGGTGLRVEVEDGVVQGSHARDNREAGVRGSGTAVSGSTAAFNQGNGFQIDNGSVTHCSAANNGGHGIGGEALAVAHSAATSNRGSGLFVAAGSVFACTSRGNWDHGIWANGTVVAFSRAWLNNQSNGGFFEIGTTGAVSRTGNIPSP
jgi:hypothetical protein